ncbi:proline dehydrogenase family protein [Bailinhaonella thermotolerans]|uniref:proline dehydrogenase n=1 Tax=Bailinhaonella thermotolerans TaxID=1070861 RepID=A0A3A4AAT6_9ACTN|nr:proline dehydrogenase family protein [Bailinhaonella thermotolerans]RJL22538.1 proline dehydrogenase [Bailinhaonella thermotolerans]
MLRRTLLAASRSPRLERAARTAPVARSVVRRYVAGDRAGDALRVTRELCSAGLRVTIDNLGEDVTERAHAERTAHEYVALLRRIAEDGLAPWAEVSVKLSALGQKLGGNGAAPSPDGEKIALDNAARICAAAEAAGTTVTLDMEDHETVDSTLGILAQLRVDHPRTGAVIQSYLRRSEGDCLALAGPGSRVRLCKGAYDAPASAAFTRRRDIDLSYARCLRVLMNGRGHPMVATHDPRLIDLAVALAALGGRDPGTYELQMLYGVRPRAQARLAAEGQRVRVYVPYGDDWYGYLVRRLAERPANLAFFLRSLLGRG